MNNEKIAELLELHLNLAVAFEELGKNIVDFFKSIEEIRNIKEEPKEKDEELRKAMRKVVTPKKEKL